MWGGDGGGLTHGHLALPAHTASQLDPLEVKERAPAAEEGTCRSGGGGQRGGEEGVETAERKGT